MLLDQFVFILWLFLLTEIVGQSLDPAPAIEDDLNKDVYCNVSHHDQKSQHHELEFWNFQPEEVTKWLERI